MSSIVAKLTDAGIDLTGVKHTTGARSEEFCVPGHPNQSNQHAFAALPGIAKMLEYLGYKLRIGECKVGGGNKVIDRVIVDYS